MDEGKLTNSIEVYLPSNLAAHRKYLELAGNFAEYLKGDNPKKLFGSDSPYIYPDEAVDARLYHVHLLVPKDPNYKNKVLSKRTSDTILVYARDLVDDKKCLLIAILEPGHVLQRDSNRLRQYADLASRWRNRDELPEPKLKFTLAGKN